MSPPSHHAATDHVLVLADGRRLGYATFGDPEGRPVVNCHGGLVSRNDVQPADEFARAHGICIISPDRPGVGLSDRKPGHRLLDWVREDLTELLDRIGVDRCSAMGWSEGGQYALAVGHALADRVDRVACIAGCVPLDDPASFARLSRLDRTLARLSTRAPFASRGYFHLTRTMATRSPARFVKLAARTFPEPDARVVLAEGDWLARISAEGAHDARGAVDEYRAFVAPWGFRPEDVAVPVDVHQGTVDELVPEAWGHELAERIPDATLRTYPGEGHLIAVTHRTEILAQLLEPQA